MRPKLIVWMLGVASVVVATSGCGRSEGERPPDWRTSGKLPERLSELSVFAVPPAELNPAGGTIEYRINSSSFHDLAELRRHLQLPPDGQITVEPDGNLRFPAGTLVAQTLGYRVPASGGTRRRWIETRVLEKTSSDWKLATYVWNDEQTDAVLKVAGDQVALQIIDPRGESVAHQHLVPNLNDCKRCHKVNEQIVPLALGVDQLNGDLAQGTNQLHQWQTDGVAGVAPPIDTLPRLTNHADSMSGTLDERARAWLHVNCVHCHNPQGAARNSGLYLGVSITEPVQYGVYKPPVAAGRGTGGRRYDIVPGQPDESILIYRISSTEPGIAMPEYGRTVLDHEGIALMRQWIAAMPDPHGSASDLVGEVTWLSGEELTHWVSTVGEQGDATRGESIIRRTELNCLQCHALQGVGGKVGPDLLQLPPDTTVAQVIESILLPSKTVSPQYRAVTVQTVDGLVLTGIIAAESDTNVVLRDPVRGDTVLARRDIEEMEDAGSLMPGNAVARLTTQEFCDLVSYLAAGLSSSELESSPTAAGK